MCLSIIISEAGRTLTTAVTHSRICFNVYPDKYLVISTMWYESFMKHKLINIKHEQKRKGYCFSAQRQVRAAKVIMIREIYLWSLWRCHHRRKKKKPRGKRQTLEQRGGWAKQPKQSQLLLRRAPCSKCVFGFVFERLPTITSVWCKEEDSFY